MSYRSSNRIGIYDNLNNNNNDDDADDVIDHNIILRKEINLHVTVHMQICETFIHMQILKHSFKILGLADKTV